MEDKKRKRILDFIEYKKSGKLSYIDVDDKPVEDETPDDDETLAQMAEVMTLSTDELFLEIGFILDRGLDLLLQELSGRLVLMESICLYASNLAKS